MADNNGDAIFLPSDQQMAKIGVTAADIAGYPQVVAVNDKILFGVTDHSRKQFAGVDGTNIQMNQEIEAKANDLRSEDGDQETVDFYKKTIWMGQVSVFFLKNELLPMLSDVIMLSDGAMDCARRLEDGNQQAVNRRARLTEIGFLKPQGNDVVPDNFRNEWLNMP